MNEYYGLVPENPLKMSGVRASMTLVLNLVTCDGFHILFHRPETVLSPTLKFEDGNERILDIYELITGDGKIVNLYIDIYNEVNQWIPPYTFLFENDMIFYENGDEIEVIIDSEFVFEFEQINMNIDQYYERKKEYEIEKNLISSWGVNFKTNNFPAGLIEIYKNRNSR